MKKQFVAILLCILMVVETGITSVSADNMISENAIINDYADDWSEEDEDLGLEIGAPAPATDFGDHFIANSDLDAVLKAPEGEKGVGITYRSMDEIEAYFDEHPASLYTDIKYASGGAPAFSGKLSAGKLSNATVDSAVNTMNRIRYIAGLNEVKADADYSSFAQTAAFISYLNGSFSHNPDRPTVMIEQDDMYEIAKYGCANSNLAYRFDSDKKNYSIDKMLVKGWMSDDSGDNLKNLGHRRWIIYPAMQYTGFGAIKKDGYTYAANYVIDEPDDTADYRTGVPWPARNMPVSYFSKNDPWSFSVGNVVTESTVRVTLKRRNDNKTWKFFTGTNDGAFYVDNFAYGLKGCIIFRPDGIDAYNDGDIYDVNITYGNGQEIAYTVNFFELFGDRNDPMQVAELKACFVDGSAIKDDRITLDSTVCLLTDTEYSKIYYTLDGSTPIVPADLGTPPEPTKLYTDAIRINTSDINTSAAVKGKTFGTVTVKAVGVKEGFVDSSIFEKVYSVIDDSEDWGDIIEEDRGSFANPTEVKDQLWVSGITSSDYTGKQITFPEMRVYMYKTLLTLNKDYTVKYKNNTKVGTATILVTGKGNYTDTKEENFVIKPLDLSNAEVLDFALAYKEGVEQKGVPSVKYRINGSDVTLKLKKDFVVEYSEELDYTNVGSYPVIIKAVENGNYVGSKAVTELITDKKLISKAKVAVKNMPYNKGEEVRPEPIVTFGSAEPLEKGTDYVVNYSNNVDVGTAVMVITGKGEYVGTKRVTFKISGININKFIYEYTNSFAFTGKRIEPALAVYGLTDDGTPSDKPLTLGKDYKIKYTNNTNVGTKATIEVTGLGNYTGTVKKYFKIAPFELAESDLWSSASAIYAKGGARPEIKVKANINGTEYVLEEGVDYTVSLGNNKSVLVSTEKLPFVKIKGKGNYKGTVQKNFTIQKADIANTDVIVSDIVYKNAPGICKPSITLVDVDGKTLSAGKDYTKNIKFTYAKTIPNVVIAGPDGKPLYDDGKEVTETRRIGRPVGAKDIIPVGAEIQATIESVENGNYYGVVTKVFRYTKANISSAKIKLKNAKYYTGKAIYPAKNDIIVTIGETELWDDDYDIIGYTNNIKKGTGKITIQGKGNYGGRKTLSFSILARLISLFL